MAEIYTSLFKGKVHITTPYSSKHPALDMGNYKTRNPIYSPNKLGKGKVSKQTTSYTYGGVLYKDALTQWIKYDNGFESCTVHGSVADRILKVGDLVKVGQLVYRTGNKGYSKGDHLHYQLKKNGVLVDPTKYVMNDMPIEAPTTPPAQTECEKRVIELEAQVAGLKSAVGSAEVVIKTRDDSIRLLTERNTYLEEVTKETNSQFKGLEKLLKDIQDKCDKLSEDYKAVSEELKELKEGRDTWINRLADILHKLFTK